VLAVYFCQAYCLQPDIIPTGSITRKPDNSAGVPGPADLISPVRYLYEQRGMASRQHRYYIKRLRYYLGYHHEYTMIGEKDESLAAWAGQLQEKNR